MDVPLVEHYKREFILRRLLQSFLGGPKILLSSCVPPYVYIIQMLTFLVPLCFGYLISILSSLGILNFPFTHLVMGISFVLFFIMIRICLAVVSRKTNSVAKLSENILAQEDEIEFVSCCEVSTCEFIFSLKHGWFCTAAKLLCGLVITIATTDFLLPEHVDFLFQDKSHAFLIIGFGWFSYATSIYSLVARPPPEMSSFYDQQIYLIASFSRPAYLIFLFTAHFFVRIMDSIPTWLYSVDLVFHILFCILPFLWVTYALPPIDALFIWIAEIINISVFGSSTLCNDFYLVLYIMMSICLVFSLFLIKKTIGVLVVASFCGYLFSLNTVHIVKSVVLGKKTDKIVTNPSKYINVKSKEDLVLTTDVDSQFSYLFHPFKIVLVILVVLVCHYFIDEHFVKVSSFLILGYLNIIILVLIKMASELSKISLFGGLFRNPVYSVSSYNHKKKWITAMRTIFVKECLPFYLLFNVLIFAKCDLEYSDIEKNNLFFLIIVTCMARQLRWVWQSTEAALLELMLLFTLDNVLGSTWNSLLITIKLTILSFMHAVFLQSVNKIWMVALIAIPSVTQVKQRRPYSVCIFVMNLLFLPVICIFIAITSALSSPLMPLFSLPIFLIAFPRPKRFWPHTSNEEVKHSDDAALYEQAIPQVSQELFLAERKGRLGHLTAGDFLLLRFGNRMLWVYVMESGNDYYVYQMKGLELQETSCHTVEAVRIDDLFGAIFNHDNESCFLNPFWFSCLTPLCQITINSYSEAKNILTGVIDNPGLIKLVGQLFPKCLVWVIANYSLDSKISKDFDSGGEQIDSSTTPRKSRPDSSHLLKALPKYESNQQDVGPSRDISASVNPLVNSRRSSSADSSSVVKTNRSAWGDSKIFDATTHTSFIRVEPARGSVSSPSTTSIDSWMEDVDDNASSLCSSARLSKVELLPMRNRNVPGFLTESMFHEPVSLINRNISRSSKKQLPTLPVYSSNYSVSLAPPVSWFDIPCELSIVRDSRLFPADWFHYVIENLYAKYVSMRRKSSSRERTNCKELSETVHDEALESVYRKIVVICVLAVSRSLEEGDSFNGARHIHNIFNGDIPWSLKSEWLAGKPELQTLVLQAYRYAVKMSIDMILLGESSESFPDVMDYLEDFDMNWLMGSHTDESWKESILSEKPNLFSIGYNEIREVFTSHLLTLQPTQINVAYLNGEVIRGLWSSLSFELLYLTNDDEERYSIQAHPTILRNLTVQSADPPLGYPIYISAPIYKSVKSWSDLY